MKEIYQMGFDGDKGREVYSVRELQRLGQIDPYLNPDKIREIWVEYSQHDVLFSDYTRGEVEPFLDMLFSPRAIIAEIYRVDEEVPVGLLMGTRIIPGFDALGHFTLWDSKMRGKEPLFWEIMRIWMDEFKLRRISAETPGFMKGVIRMIKRLGFEHEGTRREGTIHKGSWVDMEMFGILRSELDVKLQEG